MFCQDIQKHFDKESDPEGYDVISVSITITFEGLIVFCDCYIATGNTFLLMLTSLTVTVTPKPKDNIAFDIAALLAIS